MPLDLTKIWKDNDSGTSNMGSLTFGRTIDGSVDSNDRARFWIPNKRFALLSVRVHFSLGTGTSTDCVINIDSGLDEAHDATLMTIANAGTDGDDVHFRIAENDMQHWIFDGTRGDKLVLTWANPDDGTMRWGAEVFLYPIDADTML